MNDTGKILAAFAAGAALGVIAGILFAPGKGSETRKKISDSGRKIVNVVKEKFRAGKEKFDNLKEEFEQAVNEKPGEVV